MNERLVSLRIKQLHGPAPVASCTATCRVWNVEGQARESQVAGLGVFSYCAFESRQDHEDEEDEGMREKVSPRDGM